MAKTERQIALDKFKDFVIKESRNNLVKAKKVSSKTLYNSIGGEVKHSANSVQIFFEMANQNLPRQRCKR